MPTAYQDVITIEPGKRGGRPTIRGLRITVGDVLGWLAAGMTPAEIVADFPEPVRSEPELQALRALGRPVPRLYPGAAPGP